MPRGASRISVEDVVPSGAYSEARHAIGTYHTIPWGEALYLLSLGGLAPNHGIGAPGNAPPSHSACRGSVLHSKHVPRAPDHVTSCG